MAQPASDKCLTCGKSAYPRERIVADGKVFHANCFKYVDPAADRAPLRCSSDAFPIHFDPCSSDFAFHRG